MSPLRLAMGLASPGFERGKLSILIFHRVLARPDPLFPGEVDRQRFDQVCSWVREWCNVLPLDVALRRLRDGTLPTRALAITFDDGYRDNEEVALPILRRHGLCATFFIATGFLGNGRMWNDTIIEAVRATSMTSLDLAPLHDGWAGESLPLEGVEARRTAVQRILPMAKYLPLRERVAVAARLAAQLGVGDLPTNLMMSTGQVRSLAVAGMQIGAHTVNHPILSRATEADALAELTDSRDALQDLLQAPVTMLAYPNGVPGDDVGDREVALAERAGFELAVTTQWGYATRDTHPHRVPRFSPWDRSRCAYGLRLIRNLLQPAARWPLESTIARA